MKKERKERLIAFGHRLQELRESRGLSQMELANMLDVNYRQISRYETGEAEMGSMLYARLQEALAVKIDSRLSGFLQQWETLTPENKEQLLSLARIMNQAQEKE